MNEDKAKVITVTIDGATDSQKEVLALVLTRFLLEQNVIVKCNPPVSLDEDTLFGLRELKKHRVMIEQNTVVPTELTVNIDNSHRKDIPEPLWQSANTTHRVVEGEIIFFGVVVTGTVNAIPLKLKYNGTEKTIFELPMSELGVPHYFGDSDGVIVINYIHRACRIEVDYPPGCQFVLNHKWKIKMLVQLYNA